MTYQTILTTYGLTAQAAAVATTTPINLVAVAVGDGNGNATTPSLGQTALVREVYRAAPNRVEVNPENSQQYFVELVIPAATGGWVIREFGIFDDDGGLIAVGNFPETYKSVPADGAVSDLILQTIIEVSNAGVITIVLDPTATVASRAWVLNNVTRASLFPGGTTGQVLRKKSNADGDTEWADPATANILVNTIEEPVQTLAAAQTTVTLTTTNTTGLAVFIEGIRIPKAVGVDGWQQGGSNTQVVLGKAYPAGTRFFAAQNEPSALIPNPLDSTKNLSDVQSAATSRTNLDVFSRAETQQFQPAGNVAWTARATAPSGWLVADGSAVSRTTYAALFSAIGSLYGAGNGTTTFNLPDLRGEFVRGADMGRGVDVGRAIGSAQGQAIQSHTHGGVPVLQADVDRGSSGSAFSLDDIGQTASTGGTETRPRNIALVPIIKT